MSTSPQAQALPLAIEVGNKGSLPPVPAWQDMRSGRSGLSTNQGVGSLQLHAKGSGGWKRTSHSAFFKARVDQAKLWEDLRHLQDKPQETQLKPARWHPIDFMLGTQVGQYGVMVLCATFLISTCALSWAWLGGTPEYPATFKSSLWLSWGIFFDPGTQTSIAPTDSLDARVLLTALCFSICGYIYMLTILGIFVEVIRKVLKRLEKERSRVYMTGHVLILGWTDKTIFLLQELLHEADNRGFRRQRIVILADLDEIEMRKSVKGYLPKKAKGRWFGHVVHFRRGTPHDFEDLQKASVATARQTIVLGYAGPAYESDLKIFRIMLAIASLPTKIHGRILVEVRCPDSSPVVDAILPGQTDCIHARSTVMRMLCLMACKPVIGDCLVSLSSFVSGEEMYCVRVPALDGQKFKTASRAFSRGAICIGVKPLRQQAMLAPGDDYVIQNTDRLLLIATDACSIDGKEESETVSSRSRRQFHRCCSPCCPRRRVLPTDEAPLRSTTAISSDVVRHLTGRLTSATRALLPRRGPKLLTVQAWVNKAEQEMSIGNYSLQSIVDQDSSGRLFIVLGWSDDIPDLVKALDKYVRPNTEVHLMSERSKAEQKSIFIPVLPQIQHIVVFHHTGRRTSVDTLVSLPLAEAHSIIVLGVDSAGEGRFDAITSDSDALTCAVTIHNIAEGHYGPERKRPLRGRIICEALDPQTEAMLARNHELNKSIRFFHSNALETGLFAMATSETTIFNILVQLLAPTHDLGKLVSEPITRYLEAEKLVIDPRAETPSMALRGSMQAMADDPSDDVQQLSFWEMHELVRAQADALLIGWHRVEDGVTELGTVIDREKPLTWSIRDRLVLVKPQRGLATAAKRKKSVTAANQSAASAAATVALMALRRVFNRHDQDHDGLLSFRDFQALLADIQVSLQ